MVAEDHYIHESQMTDLHREKITELRKRAAGVLQKYPEYDTDFSMLRWLMGWDYDIDVILPKMKSAVDTLVNLGMNELSYDTPEEINSYVRNMTDAATFFPGGLVGQDAEGNVVYMQALAQTHPRTLVKAGCVSELFLLNVIETELSFKLVRTAEKKSGKKLGVKIILDLDGFSMDLLYTPTLKIYLSLLSTMQDVFPDFARKIYVINPPMMMQTVYAMISPALSKQTREKVAILGSDWKEILNKDIGQSNIYPHWGGTKSHEHPKGDLRMGGNVPEKLHYNSENNPDDQKGAFTKISIGARSKESVAVSAQKGQTIRWIWKVSSGDLDFWAECEGKDAYPKFRLSSEFVPEMGKLQCRESGEYTFYFDNSHGKIFGKDVKYQFFVEN